MLTRAQDLIIKTNGDEIKAKVQEITLNEVKFRKFENLDGPLYTVQKYEIFMIKYANGEKEIINASGTGKPQEQGPIDYTIVLKGDRYYQNGSRLSERGLRDVIDQGNNKRAIMEMQQGISLKKLSKPMYIASIPAGVVGIVGVVWGSFFKWIAHDTYSGYQNSTDYEFGETLQTAGIVFTVVGVGCLATGIGASSSSKTHIRKAVELYNSGLKNGKTQPTPPDNK